MADPESFPVTVGTLGVYEWLMADNYLDDLLRLCPEMVIGKYLAVTSIDSGFLVPNEEEKAAGWESHDGIAYSPRISTVEKLPHEGWDEWYVFEDQFDLGRMAARGTNIFEAPPTNGVVHAFVNFNLDLRRSEMNDLADLFWRQLDWIHPQTYIAESDSFLTIVSADQSLFSAGPAGPQQSGSVADLKATDS